MHSAVVSVIPNPVAAQTTGAVASSILTVEPTRVLDTRFGTGLANNVSANTNNQLQITGSIATRVDGADANQVVVPAGATGVLLNVTALRPDASGFISIRPGTATGEPSASNLNAAAGQVIPNAVTTALAPDGTIDIWYGTGTAGATTGWERSPFPSSSGSRARAWTKHGCSAPAWSSMSPTAR